MCRKQSNWGPLRFRSSWTGSATRRAISTSRWPRHRRRRRRARRWRPKTRKSSRCCPRRELRKVRRRPEPNIQVLFNFNLAQAAIGWTEVEDFCIIQLKQLFLSRWLKMEPEILNVTFKNFQGEMPSQKLVFPGHLRLQGLEKGWSNCC